MRFIQRKNWLIATHELCPIMFFIAPTLFVSCEQIALVDPSSNNLAIWMMIHHALPKSSGWLPIARHQVLQYNKKTSHQSDIIFRINKKKSLYFASLQLFGFLQVLPSLHGPTLVELFMVWVPNIAPCYGMCLVLIGVRVLYAICDLPWHGWIRL